MNKKTLLVIVPGKDTTYDAEFNLLVAETGESLNYWFCSHYCYAKHDLYDKNEELKQYIKERFGDVEIKFIDETNI